MCYRIFQTSEGELGNPCGLRAQVALSRTERPACARSSEVLQVIAFAARPASSLPIAPLNQQVRRLISQTTAWLRPKGQVEKPDLQDYVAPVWRYKWLILALALTVALSTYIYYDHKPKSYRASTEVYLGSSGVDQLITGTQSTESERELANQARVLRSREVAARVAQRVGFKGDPEELLRVLQVTADPEADLLTLITVWPNPHGAANLANAFAQAFLDQRLAIRRHDAEQVLQAARAAMADLERSPTRGDERAELAARISQLEVLRSLRGGTAEQLDRARPAAAPSGPRPGRNAIFAFILSITFGILAAYGMERIDRRIRKIDEVTSIFDAPVLGTIPRAAEKLSYSSATAIPTSLRESFRTLRTSLEMAGADTGTLLVTSGVPGEGKSTIVRNLALAFVESGKEVVIVEADMRRPTAARWLSVPDEPGLAHVLMGDATLDEALHWVLCDAPPTPAGITITSHNGSAPGNPSENGSSSDALVGSFPGCLFLLPGGSPAANPPTLLSTHGFQLLLVELAERFDLVLIDTPPLLPVSDAMPLLTEVIGTLVVSRVGSTTEDSAERVAELIGRVRGARVLGVVANDVPVGAFRAGYGLSEYEPAT